jgi:hypothetical protein
MAEEFAGGGRDLRKDGLQIAIPVYIEVRNWLNQYFSTRAYDLESRGIAISPGEKKGAGNALARMVAFMASLIDEDLEWIQSEGATLVADLDRHPPSYGKTAGRIDPMTIPRRTASVFIKPVAPVGSGPAADVVANPGGVVEGKAKILGVVTRTRRDGADRHDERTGQEDGSSGRRR